MEVTQLKGNIEYLRTTIVKLEEKIDMLVRIITELRNEIKLNKQENTEKDLNKAIDQITQQFANITTPKTKKTTNYLIYDVEEYKKKLNKS